LRGHLSEGVLRGVICQGDSFVNYGSDAMGATATQKNDVLEGDLFDSFDSCAV
jgi:hypothetical protein